MHRSRNTPPALRVRGWGLVGLLLVLSACATTTPEPRTRPAPETVEPAAVPPPPADASAAIEAEWLELVAGAPVTVGDDPSPEGRTLAGFAALRQGRTAEATAAFQAALEARPQLAQAEYGLGLTALLQDEPDVAREWLSRALAHDPSLARAAVRLRALALGDVEGALTRAEAAQRSGDPQAEAAAYREALDAAPDVAALYLRLARALDDESESLAVLERGRRRAGDDPALLAELGRRYRALERYDEAAEVYRALADLRPGDAALAELAEQTRREYETASLPAEYRQLPKRDTITREDLAAILAIELEGLEPDGGRAGVFVSDVDDRWSSPFIQRMVEWGVMDVYQNNAFWPDLEVRRSMLVEAAYRVLQVMGVADEAPRPAIQDPPPEHLLYRPVQAIVGLDIMQPRSSGSFDLLEPVSGAEAIRAAERLAAAVRRLQS